MKPTEAYMTDVPKYRELAEIPLCRLFVFTK